MQNNPLRLRVVRIHAEGPSDGKPRDNFAAVRALIDIQRAIGVAYWRVRDAEDPNSNNFYDLDSGYFSGDLAKLHEAAMIALSFELVATGLLLELAEAAPPATEPEKTPAEPGVWRYFRRHPRKGGGEPRKG